MSSIYIAGIGMTRLGKFPTRSVKDMTREAVNAALDDAGASIADLDYAWFANTRQALLEGQNVIRGQCALRAMGIEGIPIINVENACASSTTGLNQAVATLKAEMADVALVVGAEKMFFPEKKEAMFTAFLGGTDIYGIDDMRRLLKRVGAGIAPPGADSSDGDLHSFFMDYYAAFARAHMKRFGTRIEHLAKVAEKNHHHSTMNPLAQYQVEMAAEAVLKDKMIAWPLTRSMCAPISDGAAAAVVCTEAGLARLGGDRGRAVRILAQVLVSGTDRSPDDWAAHLGRRAARLAYEKAGLGPDDMDMAEVHDASAFAEIVQIENLGFCPMGEGGETTARGETTLGGRIPVNTSGGLLSKGHPIAATGLIQLHELVAQLRGEAGRRQVEGARLAVAENGGGVIGVEEAAMAVTILGKN
ncbi:MAG: thiolase family protein [Alphaproteobacteria bacterium]